MRPVDRAWAEAVGARPIGLTDQATDSHAQALPRLLEISILAGKCGRYRKRHDLACRWIRPYSRSWKCGRIAMSRGGPYTISAGSRGYRRITAVLKHPGWRGNHKRFERIWREQSVGSSNRLLRAGSTPTSPQIECLRRKKRSQLIGFAGHDGGRYLLLFPHSCAGPIICD